MHINSLQLLSLSLTLICQQFFAQNISAAVEYDLKSLSQEDTWRALLGFHDRSKSEVLPGTFFLSESGRKDPYIELKTTLSAFAKPVSGEADEHAQCRFPARKLWLERHLDFSELGISDLDCPAYMDFIVQGNVDSVSLVYATGFLGNPASYYGHLLVKLNQKSSLRHVDLQDQSVNFGAIIPDNENMLVYILKGVFGGYSSGYTHREYFYHTHNYGEAELRDLWEYELNLHAKDRDLLLAHTWELIGKQYQYFFFNRNCAYQIGQLLGVITEDSLASPFDPWVLPQVIVQNLVDMQYQNKPLVAEMSYTPSRQSRLYQRYAQLTEGEKADLSKGVRNLSYLDSEEFNNRSLSAQHRVIDTLLDYYQFRLVGASEDKKQNIEKNRKRVLVKRYQTPPGESDIVFSSQKGPHKGRRPSYISVGAAEDSNSALNARLHIRPAYYDALDSGFGHIKNSSLSMGEVILTSAQGRTLIQDLNLVKIENINQNMTGLPGDRARSWRLEVGAQERKTGCDNCLAFKANGALGYAGSPIENRIVVSAMGGLGYLSESIRVEGAYASARVSAIVNASSKLSMEANAEIRQHVEGQSAEEVYQFQGRYALSRNIDLRIHYRHHVDEEFALSIGYYW